MALCASDISVTISTLAGNMLGVNSGVLSILNIFKFDKFFMSKIFSNSSYHEKPNMLLCTRGYMNQMISKGTLSYCTETKISSKVWA